MKRSGEIFLPADFAEGEEKEVDRNEILVKLLFRIFEHLSGLLGQERQTSGRGSYKIGCSVRNLVRTRWDLEVFRRVEKMR